MLAHGYRPTSAPGAHAAAHARAIVEIAEERVLA